MNRLRQLKTYPFGLFLWLEWILLGGAIFSDLPGEYLFAGYEDPERAIMLAFCLTLGSMLVIGLMGLNLPDRDSSAAWIYLGSEIVMLWLPNILGYKQDLSLFLLLIIALRNGIIFQPRQSRFANLALFLAAICMATSSLSTYSEFQAQFTNIDEKVLRYQGIDLVQHRWIIVTLLLRYSMESALCIILIWLIVNVVLKEHNSQQQLAQARQQLREYALKAEDRATVNERNRIAREIHDSLGHALTAQSIQLNNAIAFWQSEPDKAYGFLQEAKTLVATALKEIRYSVASLRSDPLQNQNLHSAIATLFQEFSHRTGVIPHYHGIEMTSPIAKEVKTTAYRIVQEALTNIAKHSEATQVRVELQATTEYLRVIVTDNGRGFDPAQNITGMGIQGMRERAIALNGYLAISSQIGRGCTISVHLPHGHAFSLEDIEQ
ncbi:MAG: sensor histidine kinase [Cyanobacteria bacterium J06623_7]